MSEARTSYFGIGLLVIAVVVLAVAAAVYLVLGSRPIPGVTVETCFDEDVRGLHRGSPLLLRGIAIGRVTGIALLERTFAWTPADPRFRESGHLIRVRIGIDPASFPGVERAAVPRLVEKMVEWGLRVGITRNLVTGGVSFEARYAAPEEIHDLKRPWRSPDPYIPTIRSRGILDSAGEVLDLVGERIDVLDLAGLQGSARGLLERGGALLERLDRVASGLDRLVERADRVLAARDDDVAAILRDLASVGEKLDDLTERARRYPAGALFGGPPERRRSVR